MSNRDKRYLLALLFAVLWYVVSLASGCKSVDAPFRFFSGCYNYGIDWNAFMAPIGLFAIAAFPISIVYFLMRLVEISFGMIKNVIRKEKKR